MALDSFIGTKDIILQPSCSKVPYTFTFTTCSSATANDGHLPYGTNISSVVVTASKDDGTVATSDLINSSSVATNTITVKLKYPSTNGTGRYFLNFAITLDNVDSTVIDADFKRIYAEVR